MTISLPANVYDDVKTYKEKLALYLDGELSDTEFKAVRVPMGVYEQRKSGSFMLRIRIPAGYITAKQIKKIASIAEQYTLGPIHITTRQEIQIHNLSLDHTPLIMEELLQEGLSSRGGGGNTVRNIIADPYSAFYAAFDVLPYAAALTQRLVSENDSWNLPRKFKICFGSSYERPFLSLIADVGLIPLIKNNTRGFSVYVGGGLGTGAMTGIKFYDFLPEENLYALVRAVKELFDQHGNRRNKYKARLRFLVKEWGEAAFINRLQEKYREILAKNPLPLDLKQPDKLKSKAYIDVSIKQGYMSPEELYKLGEILEAYDSTVIRFTHRQNILIYNIEENDIAILRQKLAENGYKAQISSVWDKSVACAGASTCRLGLCLSGNLLTLLSRKLREEGKSEKIRDLVINISGCPNNCAQTLAADIGFAGAVKRAGDKALPAYTVFAGANLSCDNPGLAERLGTVAAEDIADMLGEIFSKIESERKDESFYSYYAREGKKTIKNIVKKYEDKKDKNYSYRDIFDTAPFSVLEKLEGECSAGLFDLIEMDIKEAKTAYKKADYSAATVSAARALLVTKAIEEREEKAVLKAFTEKFYGIHIAKEDATAVQNLLAGKSPAKEEAEKLISAVEELYNNMDNSLRFPEIDGTSSTKHKKTESDIKVYDYRGVPCPINFVKAKLVLEPLSPGSIVEFLLDDGQPIENVPASLSQEGHKVLQKEKQDKHWKIKVKRK